MKAKYFSHCDYLDAPLEYSFSYSWKSIWSSKALIKEGCLWCIGNGEKIGVWSEPWVMGDEGRFILSSPHDGIEKVNHLIDFSTREWKNRLIEDLFNEKDVKCIFAIPLSSMDHNDEIT